VTWTCEQTEARLSDYLDRALSTEEMAAFNAHVPGCPRCAPLLTSVSTLVMDLQTMEQIPQPPRLIYAILDKTLGPREPQTGWRGALEWVRAIASLRFAYGALSVAGTLMLLLTASGFNWRHPKLVDLQPANVYRSVDRKIHLAYAGTTEFVSNLRVVNEIQSRLQRDNDLPTLDENTPQEDNRKKEPGHSDGAKPASPRQQNRANGLVRDFEALASYVPAYRVNAVSLMLVRRVL
jgi:anti-sigma factor RsiW